MLGIHWTRDRKDEIALTAIILIFVIECIEVFVKYLQVNHDTRMKSFLWNGIETIQTKVSRLVFWNESDDKEYLLMNKYDQFKETRSPPPFLAGNDIESPGNNSGTVQPKPVVRLDLDSVNTYDLFKLFATIFMFVDHYGYMGLPGLTWHERGWTRAFGRLAAPPFFFLSGWASKRFRMRTWIASIFIYISCVQVPVKIVFTPFESILTIATINCLFKYIQPHTILVHPVISIIFIGIGIYLSEWIGNYLGIAYASIPFMLAISGDLMKRGHSHRFLWIWSSMIFFGYRSDNVFGRGRQNNAWSWTIWIGAFLNGLVMSVFQMKEIHFLNLIPSPLKECTRDGIKWISRNGLVVYIGHLILYRLIVSSRIRYEFV